MTVLNCLKWSQLALAGTTAIALGVVFIPSVEMIVLLPFGLLYLFWAIRTIHDRRVSMWLACLTSLTIAVLLGTLSVSGGLRAFQATDTNSTVPPLVMAPVQGEVKVLDTTPANVRGAVQKQQASAILVQRVATIFLYIVTLGAWIVVVMHALQWRWLLSGKITCG